MKNERDPDLQFPDEKDLEERVKRMMDLSAPETPEPEEKAELPEAPEPVEVSESPEPVQAKKISVISHSEEEVVDAVSAPEATAPAKLQPKVKVVSKQPIAIAVSNHEDKAEAEAPGAPPLAASDIPKNIVITHFTVDDPVEPEEAKDVEEPVEMPETVENPLIPTDKLSSIITSKVPEAEEPEAVKVPVKTVVVPKAKTAKKTTQKPAKQVEQVEEVVAEDLDTDIETEIAEAFGGDTTPDETAVTDEFDELAAEDSQTETLQQEATQDEVSEVEPTTEEVVDASTPEELSETSDPTTDETLSESSPEVKKVKVDPFTPLTNIRPRLIEPQSVSNSLKLDDAATSRAVDDIVVADADKLLQIPDESQTGEDADNLPVKTAKPATQRIKRKLRKGKLIAVFVGLLLVALIAALAVPTSRFKVLNSVGVRADANIIVTDRSTNLPLKNATVTVGSISKTTDANGQAQLRGIKLGQAEISISKKAFAATSSSAKLNFGSNKLASVSLVPTGKQYKVMVSDFVSNKPVKGEVSYDQAVAITDETGLATLTLETQLKPFEATISAKGYRTDKVTIDPSTQNTVKVALAPVRKYAYVSTKSGTQDVYRADLDGKNEQLVLKGTGKERNDSVLVANATDDVVAFVSARDSTYSLTIIDLTAVTTSTVIKAANIQIIDWNGEYLTYVQTLPDAKPADATRQQLVSYNYKSKKTQSLAAANYFNSVSSAASNIYFAPSSAYQPGSNVGFFKINPDGSGKQTLLAQETWNVYRTAYEHLSLSVHQDWYDFKLGDAAAVKQNAAPKALENRLYIDSPDGRHSLWVDGSSNLMLYDKNVTKDRLLISEKGLSYPVRWLNTTTITYRVGGQNSTDYADSLDGGTPKKIHDVSDVAGISLWQIH